jgi:hypothetical protein
LNRNLVLAGTATISVVLALFVFGSPNTGADVPESTTIPTRTPVLLQEAARPAPTTVEDKRARTDARKERLAQPDAIAAGKARVMWTSIRRELLRADSDDGRAIADVAGELMQRLYEANVHPDEADIEAIARDQATLLEKLDGFPDRSDEMNEAIATIRELQAPPQ